ncbi:MAG: tRNA (adenosine(37)-N6)-threonylcarbamoyltransferase complex ATPase subunit type 1 TsaE [Rickettsiales endosymbiont of Dermacentor nuttalli]
MNIILDNIDETKELAEKLADLVKIGDVIALKGDLGSGKTTFSKKFIKALTEDNLTVLSPTFNLLFVYNTKKGMIWHFDLYRLKNKEEVWELGIEEAINFGISLIEWPELIFDILPPDKLILTFFFSDEESKRYIEIVPEGSWHDRLRKLL